MRYNKQSRKTHHPYPHARFTWCDLWWWRHRDVINSMLRDNFSFVYAKIWCFIQSDQLSSVLIGSFILFWNFSYGDICCDCYCNYNTYCDCCCDIHRCNSKNVFKFKYFRYGFWRIQFEIIMNFEFRAMSFMAPHFHGIMVYRSSEPTKESDFSINCPIFNYSNLRASLKSVKSEIG